MARTRLVWAVHHRLGVEDIAENREGLRLTTRPSALKQDRVEAEVREALLAAGYDPEDWEVVVTKTVPSDWGSPWRIELREREDMSLTAEPVVPVVVEPVVLH